MQAIILAGGGGERLRPLTTAVPKPLLPVANQPVMERLIQNLARAGFDEVLLTTYHLAPQIAAWLQTWMPPIPVRTVQEPRPLGTAGCVQHALPLLRDEFMVAPGDVVAECDFEAFVKWHHAQRADVSLLAIRVPDTREFGILETDAASNITRFQEKPAPHEAFSNLANAGFYLMHKRAFELVPEGVPFDFSRGLFPRLLADGARFKAWEAQGYWADVGTPTAYLAANRHLLAEHGVVGPGAQIALGAELHAPYLIGAGCLIEAGAVIGPNTVLGAGCQIASGARLGGCVLHAGVRVGTGAQLRTSAVGAGAEVGAGAVIDEGCVLGAGCRVAEGAHLMPQTRYEGEPRETALSPSAKGAALPRIHRAGIPLPDGESKLTAHDDSDDSVAAFPVCETRTLPVGTAPTGVAWAASRS